MLYLRLYRGCNDSATASWSAWALGNSVRGVRQTERRNTPESHDNKTLLITFGGYMVPLRM